MLAAGILGAADRSSCLPSNIGLHQMVTSVAIRHRVFVAAASTVQRPLSSPSSATGQGEEDQGFVCSCIRLVVRVVLEEDATIITSRLSISCPSGYFLRLYPDGKDNLEFLKSPGLHVKVKFSVNRIVLSDVQEASSCLYKKIHLNYPCLLSIKEEDDEQAKGDMFERWTVKEMAANNNFRLDHKYPLTDGYCPGFRPRKGFGVDPNEVLSTVDSVLCHFSKIPQVQTGQGHTGYKGAFSGKSSSLGVASYLGVIFHETLSVTYEAKELHSFNLVGMLKMHVDKHVDQNFQIQKGRFLKENIVGIEVPDRPFPAGNSNLIRWSLHRKDESNVLCPSIWDEFYVYFEPNLLITVPLPSLREAPNVELVHGDWR
ncbi:Clathrin adaptor, mu subunit, C-terminal [Artemisia annua]|uniref:Clathrin adaptor, mu subunit, C-terminal n=1 Tax=Artemisia annua TaxID=35608 RepID=A0A2U1PIJ8_ARTAN|nr:Clathrin adaptor, mu subunit, C-terminal [Artemisia annua]